MPDTVYTLDRPTDLAVSAFAARALKVLVDTARDADCPTPSKRHPEARLVTQMVQSVIMADPRRSFQVLGTLAGEGASPIDIIDTYIPEVAKRLGRMWEMDELSFAEVSIGSARLQGLLHRLDADFDMVVDTMPRRDLPKVLVSVVSGSQHTMGASLVSSQLRREGCAVRLELDASTEELAGMLATGEYKALVISATLRESLESLSVMIKKIKAVQAELPIVVGGNILDQMEDIGALTGADCATNNLEEALRFCSLNTSAARTVQQAKHF